MWEKLELALKGNNEGARDCKQVDIKERWLHMRKQQTVRTEARRTSQTKLCLNFIFGQVSKCSSTEQQRAGTETIWE